MLCLFVAPLLSISTAAADTAGVHLIWERPPGSLCPSRAALEADVEAVLGRSVFRPAGEARVFVTGDVDELSDRVRVRIEARTARGTVLGMRELTAPPRQCASLRQAIGLVLTLFVEYGDEGVERLGDDSDTRIGFGIAGGVLSTPMPRATFAGGPTILIELGDSVRLRADANAWLPVTVRTARGFGARLYAFSLALRACTRIVGGRNAFGLHVCAGAEGGTLFATPRKLDGPDRQFRLLAQGMLELRFDAYLSRGLALDVGVGPLLSFSRPTFSFDDREGERVSVHRPNLEGIIFQFALIILGS